MTPISFVFNYIESWVYDNGESDLDGWAIANGHGHSNDTNDNECGNANLNSSPSYIGNSFGDGTCPYFKRLGTGHFLVFPETSDKRGHGFVEVTATDILDELETYLSEVPDSLDRPLMTNEWYEAARALGEATTVEEFNNIIGLLELARDNV